MYKLEPNKIQVVFVLAEASKEDGYRWTSGRTTGNTRSNGEMFEVVTDSPLAKPDKVWAHMEDLKNPKHVDSVTSLNKERRE